MKTLRFLILFIPLLVAFSPPSRTGVVVIVNPANPISSLSSEEIENIYLFKKITWKGRIKITPVNLPAISPLRHEFSDRLLSKTPEDMDNFYLIRALSGRGQPPIIARSPDQVKEIIRVNQGAIGYIGEKQVDDSVKVVPIYREGSAQ
jgi:ABC-type phosphate transport system substrate-binding protein